MRLTKLKLAGFKSFVDPTTVYFPSDLVAVVGPNGCGKSNTIDAVRWVMGESSAKNLRGEAMTDVIFNGSTARKPVGQASVELVFDNCDGTLGGAYASYNEISVKRVVTRDGQSLYYLNGARCRRRDITDIFLGTGLGPRSYAIIEQGMISRLIEAKPEELRVYLEEVSGIAKYKDRRRETQQRITHTRENLERLSDLRDELGRQLARLDAQAQAAERYQQLKTQQRTLEAQLKVMHWQHLEKEVIAQQSLLQQGEIVVEKQQAQLYATDAALEQQRVVYDEVNAEFQEVQARFYGVGTDIARIEQGIKHQQERSVQLAQDVAQNEAQQLIAAEQLQRDEATLADLQQELARLEPQQALLEEAHQQALQTAEAHEEAMRQWQHDWDDFNQRASQTTSQTTRCQTEINHWEQTAQHLEQRIARLIEEQKQLQHNEISQEVAVLDEQLAQLDMHIAEKDDELTVNSEQLQSQRQHNQQINQSLAEVREQLQQLRGQYASVEALQHAALGKEEGDLTQWLARHGLGDKPRLAQLVHVDASWEKAVEVVLENYLNAVCVDEIATLLPAAADDFPSEAVALIMPHSDVVVQQALHNLLPLCDKVKGEPGIRSLLHGIYCAENIDVALTMAPHLQVHESIVTLDGIWLGKQWLRLGKVADEKAGVFAREHLLAKLNEQIALQEQRCEDLVFESEEGLNRLRNLEEARDVLMVDVTQWRRQYADGMAQQKAKQARIEQLNERALAIERELGELYQQGKSLQAKINDARAQLQAAVDTMANETSLREQLSTLREELRIHIANSRAQMHQQKEQLTQVQIRLTSVQAQHNGLQANITRTEQQLHDLSQRVVALQLALAQQEDPLSQAQAQLDNLLQIRLQEEQALQKVREKTEQTQQQLRQLEQQRHSFEQAGHEARRGVEALRLHLQSLTVRKQTLEESLVELAVVVAEVIAGLPGDADPSVWEKELQTVHNQITRLGAINLAAIEEFKQQSERKMYLDQQNDDLLAALTTLESAIEKIDTETRICFKETFDTVNNSMKELFPRMFGGGEAYLELIGEELLEAGVSVMARPPGKKNSTIHLLSGGEKALTAVALVFSLFRLNPAPFCMLDEVDAPLDEANVGRFCRLVEEMSKTVQFIFITHNKVTMQLAKHLVGVTMREPGVSRLVSVDVDQAAEMVSA